MTRHQWRVLPAGNVTKGCVRPSTRQRTTFRTRFGSRTPSNFSVEYHRVVQGRDSPRGEPGWSAGALRARAVRHPGAAARRRAGRCAGRDGARSHRLFVASTTHLSLLVELGRLDVLTGVSRLRELIGDALLAAWRPAGQVREFAPASVIDAELVVSKRPSLLMSGGASSRGTPGDSRGRHPGRREHRMARANRACPCRVAEVHRAVLERRARARNGLRRDEGAIPGAERARDCAAGVDASAGDDWPQHPRRFVIAGGRSYVAALIKDAGGRYAWADNTAVGAPSVDLEAQIRARGERRRLDQRRRLAQPRGDARGRAALRGVQGLSDRSRCGSTSAASRTTGGNDYWSRSVSHPDLVLADLVKIFHPTLVPDHAFEWYMRVPAR